MGTAFWKTLLYGFISGLAEFLPVSSQAHRQILLRLLGEGTATAFTDLFVHFGTLTCVFMLMRGQILRIRKERALARIPKRRRRRAPDAQVMMDYALVRTASIPVLLGLLLCLLLEKWTANLAVVAAFLLVNGIVLFLPSRIALANKDARAMSRLDAVLIGAGGAVSAFPGISRMAMTTSVALVRGADKQKALQWSLLLSIPAIAGLCLLDIVHLASGGLGGIGFPMLLGCVFGAVAAWVGAYIAISFMRFIAYRLGFSGFAYYTWGAALFTFILYMTI